MPLPLRSWFRLWFTFAERVGRREYLLTGVSLAAIKYAGDAAIVALLGGGGWTPVDYLRSVTFVMSQRLEWRHPALPIVLALWTLPFVWIAVTMTMRRALDAGYSAWCALIVFLPWIRYPLMVGLGLLPTDTSAPRAPAPLRPRERRLPSALLAIAAGIAIALGMIALGVYALNRYGLALFFGMPFVVGAVTAWLLNRRYPASGRETAEVVLFTIACVGGLLLLFRAEGLVCLVMAAPLAAGLALMGSAVGRWIARRDCSTGGQTALAVLVLPLGALLEVGGAATVDRGVEGGLREVRSSIVIDAPPSLVWQAVLEFPPLPPPTDLAFRLGVAYPVRARLEGEGVGAVRYCEFSTGAFVEPITAWEPERRLAFDVTEHPAPLREWSPYRDVTPPHLEHYFRSRRGEFRLIPLPDGRTRLEGSTWYELHIHPQAYWSIWAELIVRRIHGRVLGHIAETVRATGGVTGNQ